MNELSDLSHAITQRDWDWHLRTDYTKAGVGHEARIFDSPRRAAGSRVIGIGYRNDPVNALRDAFEQASRRH